MILTKEEVEANIQDSQGWELSGEKWITKTYHLPTFPKAIQFVNSVADLAELRDHHPHITIDHKNVTIALSTLDEGGLTQKDFESAHAYDETSKKFM
ncbi:4a-hydroxytetrahydrobiopterin dehydratase [Salisediminibacterium halotolerans]|uniref:4a-hydroxytetrahydrobiopterin dehydratase n=1 Tax=Salisediminibacterium halotolerans TaxID=517425 RepID=A0A1H9VHJ4_9BACI|nr:MULTISPECIES: 4a-hydroxytetrahydrobiopterin dehydratase [Salisediminibacterium]RLJ74486.1 4a-hydroxytetrahydrobiopterin dehydratase [Actinophytocola xinjiangensis]RPE87421.1 4a-hydroxytetrahydrobiopterin dehydratase [Salisediminibacterium halotolerans]TWG35322.1 4a-hydroxytetrahydrobiopterin dehydratase [Salisediminibacterium halotolerans]SES20743.1 4a-hydroxytetrahydrobiopterin dehydratase [Salisediminibacterium haloalkalitolerans]GEL07954.1 putative pterin-4-alpha-carbinolamine dehydratas